ncbi:hypothetical protein GCK72_024655 [Caenorhabditis remanei]|uniref:Uncharacterized protein n=1 Tax=Caenorhabditis remanei TaxID=31234 RepID=A0A6A5FZT9_CAERE|nr:hypothetical protein GCK72_024655 [Caenorhabditis remanei]KAF1748188.1 hypothetical protein GCK72_024655 [Caenorhabditis remanei]
MNEPSPLSYQSKLSVTKFLAIKNRSGNFFPQKVPFYLSEVEFDFEYPDFSKFRIKDERNGDEFEWRASDLDVSVRRNGDGYVFAREGSRDEKLQKLIDYYFDGSTGEFKMFVIVGSPRQWNSVKSIKTEKLYIEIGENTTADIDGLKKILNFVDKKALKSVWYAIYDNSKTKVTVSVPSVMLEHVPNMELSNFTVYVPAELRSPNCTEECRSMVEAFAQSRPLGFKLAINIKTSIMVMSSFCSSRPNWFFTPTPNAIFRHAGYLGEAKITVLLHTSYKLRKRLSRQVPWERLLPYRIDSLLIDFENTKLEVDGEDVEVDGAQGLCQTIKDITFANDTNIMKLTIIGCHIIEYAEGHRICIKELELFHGEEYPKEFFNMFQKTRFEKVSVSSRNNIRNGQFLTECANEIVYLDEESKD